MNDFGSASSADQAAAGYVAAPSHEEIVRAPHARFDFVCYDADGNVKWEDGFNNIVTTAGRTNLVDTYLKGSAYTAAWYLVLASSGTKAAGDTLASHAGWTELTPYAGTNRPTITWGTTASGSNTSAAVSISINATATVAGAGICASQAIATLSGTLYNVGDFSAARSVASGDTLSVTITISVS